MTDTPIYDELKRVSDLREGGIHVHKGLYGDFGYTWCSWCGGYWEGPERPKDDPCTEVPYTLALRHASIKKMLEERPIPGKSILDWINQLKPEEQVFFDKDGEFISDPAL